MQAAEDFYERFKDSKNARDVKAALDSCRDCLRLLGDLRGAFPKPAPTTNIDARSLTLQGLSTDDLRALVAGLKAFAEVNGDKSLPAPVNG
jgi:autotransporter translocation and assembly factor TamB